jgi:hypothetical protein
MNKAILMTRFGIKTVVSTCSEKIAAGKKVCEVTPEHFLGGGKGKLAYYQKLIFKLREDDAFFASSLRNQQDFPERWALFLDGCLILACLHAYLFKDEI